MTKWFRRYLDPTNDAGGAGTAVIDAAAPSSVQTTVALPDAKLVATPSADANKPTPPSFVIPDSYKDKPYLKGVDSLDKVFSMLDGAQSLLGKRPAGIPAVDAAPEEWEKFYEALGRPKTAAEYQLEGVDQSDPNFISKTKEIMHRYGFNGKQASGFVKDMIGALSEMAKAQGIDLEKQNTDFDALGSKVFGNQRDQILATSKSLLDKFAPEEMKGELAKLSNENLILLAGVLNNINKTYIKQDGAPGGQPTAVGMSPADISNKARELMATREYQDAFHPQHERVKKEVNDLYNLLRPKK